jgi:hypothetical protein
MASTWQNIGNGVKRMKVPDGWLVASSAGLVYVRDSLEYWEIDHGDDPPVDRTHLGSSPRERSRLARAVTHQQP